MGIWQDHRRSWKFAKTRQHASLYSLLSFSDLLSFRHGSQLYWVRCERFYHGATADREHRKPISLISHSDVRYRGILAGIDPVASTIQLSNGALVSCVR